MAVNDWIEIYHRDGREYQVLAGDFEKNADGQYDGFKVRGYVDAANGEYLSPDERKAARAERQEARADATPEAEAEPAAAAQE